VLELMQQPPTGSFLWGIILDSPPPTIDF
jgi:hypothetical protein